jgi:hypothetical protein
LIRQYAWEQLGMNFLPLKQTWIWFEWIILVNLMRQVRVVSIFVLFFFRILKSMLIWNHVLLCCYSAQTRAVAGWSCGKWCAKTKKAARARSATLRPSQGQRCTATATRARCGTLETGDLSVAQTFYLLYMHVTVSMKDLKQRRSIQSRILLLIRLLQPESLVWWIKIFCHACAPWTIDATIGVSGCPPTIVKSQQQLLKT